jgi:hypothetical protein
MAILTRTGQADSSGTATVTISPDKSGIQWAVAQIACESFPARTTAQVVTRFNGSLLTTSAVIPSVASGAPAITLQAIDQLTFLFTGLTQGDTTNVTIYYNESPWGTIPRVDVV